MSYAKGHWWWRIGPAGQYEVRYVTRFKTAVKMHATGWQPGLPPGAR